jgi:hypothetical protein
MIDRGDRRRAVIRVLVLAAAAVLAAVSIVGPTHASVVIQLPDEDLVAGADVIVRGVVTRITGHLEATGELSTYITLRVDEVLKGAYWDPELTIRESGGTVGDRHGWASANAGFVVGEPVLLFLDQRDDGTLRTYHFYMGKFTILTDPGSGDHVAVRAVPPQVGVRKPFAAAPAVRVPMGDVARGLDDFRRFIYEHAFDPAPPTVRPRWALPFTSAPLPPTGTFEDQEDFRFIGDPNPPTGVDPNLVPGRWFGPDSNTPVTLRISSAGEPLAPSKGFDQLRAAMRVWGRVPSASFRFAEGPLINGNPGHVADGINAVSFRDPLGQISNPAGCSGVLATTWVQWTTAQTAVVSGRTFGRLIESDLVVADGWNGCGFYESFSNFAEVMTHELGHAHGLGHSADTTADFVNLGGRAGATMNAFAHFDGRAAGLHADDRAGVTFIYPARTLSVAVSGNGAVVSSTDGINCPPECVAGFAPSSTVGLTAMAGAGATFAGFTGAGCGTSVVMSADLTCAATFTSGPPSTFVDVPSTQPFFSWVETLVRAGITSGCATSPPQFCPDASVTRAEMAVFILRGLHGAGFQPPPAVGLFADVSLFNPSAVWIEQLAREGITGGCAMNPLQYCPDTAVTRGQMAVFILRAKHGSTYNPPPPIGMFTDVPTSHPFAGWVEQLAREGITSGCGGTTYCPDATVTRAQMAVFLVRAFSL